MNPVPRAPLTPRPATRRALMAGVALSALLIGCAPDRSGDVASGTTTSSLLIAPPTSGPPRSTVVPPPPPRPDTRSVELPVLTGPAPSVVGIPLEIYGGEAELSGSLGYGGEPVVGATVRLERWVDGASTFVELTTGPGGGWLARDIHGGRYVIRAWTGRLVLEQASAVFIADDEEREVHLAMAEVYVPEPDDEDEEGDEDEDEDGHEDEEGGDEDEDEDDDEEEEDGSDEEEDDESTDTTVADEDDEG